MEKRLRELEMLETEKSQLNEHKERIENELQEKEERLKIEQQEKEQLESMIK